MRLMRAHRSFLFLLVSSFFLFVDVSVSAPFINLAPESGLLTRGKQILSIIGRIPSKYTSTVKVIPPQNTIKVGDSVKGLENIKKYLDALGYIKDLVLALNSNDTDKFTEDLKPAIMEYQKNFNLPVTGVIDQNLYNTLIQPRCGVPDFTTLNVGTTPAFKPWWKSEKKELSYAFHPQNNVSDDIRTVFREAFDRWSNETSLNFTETATFDASDIKIAFVKWDGKGGRVGAAYTNYSMHAGGMFLDIDEQYVLLNVVMHEIGHLLGLGHSYEKESIMYPIVMREKIDFTDDDRKRIQKVTGNSNNGGTSASSSGTTTDSSSGGGHDSVWQRNLILGFAFMVFGIFLK